MAAFSNYLENAIIAWAFTGTSFPAIPVSGTVYVSLHTGDPGDIGSNEVVKGVTNYDRVAVAAAGWTKNLSSPASATNLADITFPTSGTVTWSAGGSGITHVGIWDSALGGSNNFLFGGSLTTARVVAVGDVFKFLANNLTISVA
jgi:hypothetical protein